MEDNDPPDSAAMTIGIDISAAMDEEFHDAPDRVLGIVGAAYLDALLEQLLRAVFIEDDKEAVDDLLGVRGVLGSNGAKYQVAYCLGLIDRHERDDLKAIADIRNAFAHQYNVRSFEDAKPIKHIAKLHFGKQLDKIVDQLAARTSDPRERKALREIGASGRRKFQDTVRNLYAVVLRKLNMVARPNKPTWYPPQTSD